MVVLIGRTEAWLESSRCAATHTRHALQDTKGSLRRAGDFPVMSSTFEGVSGHPFLGLTRYHEKRLKVTETERSSVTPCSNLIFERAREVC